MKCSFLKGAGSGKCFLRSTDSLSVYKISTFGLLLTVSVQVPQKHSSVCVWRERRGVCLCVYVHVHKRDFKGLAHMTVGTGKF